MVKTWARLGRPSGIVSGCVCCVCDSVCDESPGLDRIVSNAQVWTHVSSTQKTLAETKCQHQRAKNAFCYAWSPQTRKASLSSRHLLQKRLQCNVAGSSLARDEHVSYIRRWLPGADLCSATVFLAPNDAESATITLDTGVAQGNHVPATVQYPSLYANAHSDWAESEDQSWFSYSQGPGWQQSRCRTRLSV